MLLISNILVCVCAFVGFIWGAAKFFKPRKAVYAQMITFAVGCVAFARLYQVVRLVTGGEIFGEFQLGLFGIIGSLLFLFSANYGVMDSLGDDGSKEYKKYRVIPVTAPLAVAALYVLFVLISDAQNGIKIICGVITLFIMMTSYFNLKHLIFPDVDFGVIKCLKPYNALALLYSAICFVEMVAMSRYSEILTLIADILTGVVVIAIVYSVERGIKKWTA